MDIIYHLAAATHALIIAYNVREPINVLFVLKIIPLYQTLHYAFIVNAHTINTLILIVASAAIVLHLANLAVQLAIVQVALKDFTSVIINVFLVE